MNLANTDSEHSSLFIRQVIKVEALWRTIMPLLLLRITLKQNDTLETRISFLLTAYFESVLSLFTFYSFSLLF